MSTEYVINGVGPGETVYCIVTRDSDEYAASPEEQDFIPLTLNYADFAIELTESPAGSGRYVGNRPAWIDAGLDVHVVYYLQEGTAPDSGDVILGGEDLADAIHVTPITTSVASPYSNESDIEIAEGTSNNLTFAVTDDDGNPLDLDGKATSLTIYRDTIPTHTVIATLEGEAEGGTVTVEVDTNSSELDGETGKFRYSLRNTTDDTLLASGQFRIRQIA